MNQLGYIHGMKRTDGRKQRNLKTRQNYVLKFIKVKNSRILVYSQSNYNIPNIILI